MIAVESGGWIVQSAPFIIIDDQKVHGISYQKIGIKLVQDKPKHNNNFHEKEENSHDELKTWVEENFQGFCVRIGKSKNLVTRTQFLQNITPIQQKSRRIPILLRASVETELNKLLDQKHIKKLEKRSDKEYIKIIHQSIRSIVQKGPNSQTSHRQ